MLWTHDSLWQSEKQRYRRRADSPRCGDAVSDLSGDISDWLVFGKGIQKRSGPTLLVAGAAEPIVEDPPGTTTQVAADIVSEQKVRQKEISSPSQKGAWLGQLERVVNAEGMSADRQQGAYSPLGKEALVDEVGAGPDPEVPRIGNGFVAQKDCREHGERLWAVLLWSVAIKVGATGTVVVGGDVQRDLDVALPVFEPVGPDKFFCDAERL